jgi:tRNA threonylcarbamoyladenosine biosynthesis protein TsaB
MTSPRVLALETSTPHLVLGWLEGAAQNAVQLEQTVLVERAHAEQLPELLEVFLERVEQRTGTPPRADVIVVGAGPGSYTGVRIAASFALGLARAWRAQVISINTLMAVAAQAQGLVAVTLDAHRGRVYSAVYDNGREVVPLEKRTLEEFQPLIPIGATRLEDQPVSGVDLARLGFEAVQRGNGIMELVYL